MTPDDLRFAVLGEDAKAIARHRESELRQRSALFLELKDKLSLEDAFEAKTAHVAEANTNSLSSVKNEAVQALVAFGIFLLRGIKGN